MITLGLYEIIEIIIGFTAWWIGIYFVSRDITSKVSWLVFGILAGTGLVIGIADPILSHANSIEHYHIWQKITDWPLFIVPIFGFHISLLINKNKNKILNYLPIVGYLGGLIFYSLDIYGGMVLKESVILTSNFQYSAVFAPGSLMWPSILFQCIFLAIAARIYWIKLSESRGYLMLLVSTILWILAGILLGLSYQFPFNGSNIVFSTMVALVIILFIYPVVRFHLFTQTERLVFDKNFWLKTFLIIILSLIYISVFSLFNIPLTFSVFTLVLTVLFLIIFTHTLYDWFSTFINDLLYNPSSGFSIVNDEEIASALKNYNSPDRLDDSPLLGLKLINSDNAKGGIPVDKLRKCIKESIEYFAPEEDKGRRTKRNLKYHLLKMLAFDEAEEGQILWELGFDEYPTRLMSGSAEKRKPLFARFYPSDYTYTSRNAFLALKKEAIHDITWRISYLEKLGKRKLF
ncbi:MAG: hypothetical protein UT05_C0016G0010 [Parcubacteria group bacterium GW2011_GWF2_38_76]|nr:MAG: hypothetical protein UT05_C0016G0010 [Parcubacteria group bacterium GW2011_GWF2_38_76]